MHISLSSSSVLLAAAALTGIAGATPVNVPGTKQAFSVPQVASGEKVVKQHPAKALLAVYQKYNAVAAAPPALKTAVKKAAAATVSGSAAAIPASTFDEKYYCPVSIGGQKFNLTFDTGSSDTWVFSNLMPATQKVGHNVYDPNKTGKQWSGYTWGITYGDSSGASGTVWNDTLVVGGATATRQAIGAATSASSSFLSDTVGSGMIGLSFEALNTVSPKQQPTFFDNIKSSLALKLFTVTLKHDASGSYDFGYLDSSKYTGAITYMNVDSSSGFWMLPYGAYQVGSGKQVSLNFNKIVDSGTSLLLLPQQIVTAYYAKVKGSGYDASWGGYVFPCTGDDFSMPSMSLRVNSAWHAVPGTYMNWAPINNTHCFGGLQLSTGLPFSILGDVFLKSVYVVFDQRLATPRIGLAKQANMSAY